MSHTQRFIIIANARSGSTYLKDLLDSHPEILCFGELLNRDNIQWDCGQFNDRFNSPELRVIRDGDPVRFIESALNLAEPQDRCIGFKALYPHFSYTRAHTALVPYLLDDEGIKIIHLKRANLFKSYCSMEIARQRVARGTTMNAYRSDDVERNLRIAIDPAQCLDALRTVRDQEKRMDMLLADRRPHQATYEELIGDTKAIMQDMLEYLGVGEAPLSGQTHKVRKQPIDEVVTNYAQVERHLTQNGFGTFFSS